MKKRRDKQIRAAKPAQTRYHHGDLRAALLARAAQSLADHGSETLSLRSLAEAEGVTVAAIYRHFDSRDALLSALVEEGFASLTAKMQVARESVKGTGVKTRGRAELMATGRAYVNFAVDGNRALFRLMFSTDRSDARKQAAACDSTSLDAFGHLHAAASSAAGGVEHIDDAVLVTLWAGVHGMALLMIDGALGPDPARAQRGLDRLLNTLADAITGTAATSKRQDGAGS